MLHVTSLAGDKDARLAEARRALTALGLMDEEATSKAADVHILCLCSTIYFSRYLNSCMQPKTATILGVDCVFL